MHTQLQQNINKVRQALNVKVINIIINNTDYLPRFWRWILEIALSTTWDALIVLEMAGARVTKLSNSTAGRERCANKCGIVKRATVSHVVLMRMSLVLPEAI